MRREEEEEGERGGKRVCVNMMNNLNIFDISQYNKNCNSELLHMKSRSCKKKCNAENVTLSNSGCFFGLTAA